MVWYYHREERSNLLSCGERRFVVVMPLVQPDYLPPLNIAKLYPRHVAEFSGSVTTAKAPNSTHRRAILRIVKGQIR